MKQMDRKIDADDLRTVQKALTTLEERRFNEGRRAAQKIIRAVKARMKGKSGEYVLGWRAALNEVNHLLKVNIATRRIGETSTKE